MALVGNYSCSLTDSMTCHHSIILHNCHINLTTGHYIVFVLGACLETLQVTQPAKDPKHALIVFEEQGKANQSLERFEIQLGQVTVLFFRLGCQVVDVSSICTIQLRNHDHTYPLQHCKWISYL